MSSPRSDRPGRSLWLAAPLLSLLLFVTSSCSSMSFNRLSETHGEFYANGVAITILGIDFPRAAIDIARENLSDARQPNMQITEELITPYLGWFDWFLDIFSVRFASITGTWGFSPDLVPSAFSN